MTEIGGSWGVKYSDGSEYIRLNEDGTENSWSLICWPEVVEVAFASPFAEGQFDFRHPGRDWQVRMASRVAYAALKGSDRADDLPEMVRAFMIQMGPAHQALTASTISRVLFWFPDGSYHACSQLNCPDVNAHLHALVHGEVHTPIAESHA